MQTPSRRATLIIATCLLLAVPALATEWHEVASNYLGEGAADDQFGAAVAVQDDLVVVGTPNHDGAASNGGLVSVFRHDAASGLIQEIANLRPEISANGDLFGTSVAIDGDVIVVGARGRSSSQGRAFVFERPDEGWTGLIHETGMLMASDRGSNDLFGFAVAIDGDVVAVGARAEDQAGAQAGSVYLFQRPDTGWEGALEQDAKLLPESGSTQYAGHSVALQDSLVITGAFLRTVDGAVERGKAYVYARPDTGWGGTQSPTAILLASDGGGSDRFGISVDLEGANLIVGAYREEPPGANVNHGCIYVFEEPAGGWVGEVNEVAKLRISDPSSQCEFGRQVRIDGDRIVGTSLIKEAAYVFQRPAGGWQGVLTETAKVQADDAGNDEFGAGVAMAGPYLAVGAPEHDGLETDAGKVYLFQEGVGVAVGDGGGTPDAGLILGRAMPNPFNPRTTVAFELARSGRVRLEAVDTRGRRVAVLVDEDLAAGRHQRTWAPRGLPSGVYQLVLRQAGGRQVERLTLVK